MTFTHLIEAIQARPAAPVPLPQPVPLTALPTPALVIDRPAFERNLAAMATHVSSHGKGFRPHAKTHKCPEICRQQLRSGAVGVCVAKLSEAVALLQAGIEPILITSPIVSPAKLQVLNMLCQQSRQLALVVDSLAGLQTLTQNLSGDVQLGVLIDLDVAMGRTGCRDDSAVLAMLEHIEQAVPLNFLGFQHYAGHVMHMAEYAQRQTTSLDLWRQVTARLSDLGVSYQVLTGGGTGTYDIDTAIPEITDLQVGSFVFMDEEYRQIGAAQSEVFDDFEVALTIACTAISQPTEAGITLDAGFKSMASETVAPVADELAGCKFRFAGDEHGVLLGREVLQSVQLGDVVSLVTPHCDPTANLHDQYWVKEADGLIHSYWPITARGCSW